MSATKEYPQRHAISSDEYVRMGRAGVFAPDARLELMDGEIVEMAPIGSAHAAVVRTLTELLHPAGGRFILSVQDPLILGERSAPQPDLMLLKWREDRYYAAHPRAEDVLLLVEVADTTRDFDLNVKVPLYAQQGVAEVWVVDIAQCGMYVFREPAPHGYATRLNLPVEGSITVDALGRTIRVAGLFPR
jgi:Uma2 family endonuclease